MIGSAMEDLVCDAVFLDASPWVGNGRNNRVYLKIEGFNPAGSVKIKTARYLLDDALRRSDGPLERVIESSSGNLGIAMAMLCASRGIAFECVADPNTLAEKVALMRHFGAEVTIITRRDANGGYLGARIDYIREKVTRTRGLVWTNQYANPANVLAHYETTAPSIHRAFPALDYLFVGTGTTGTLHGCARYFARHAPATQVVAVDSVGSVTFGGAARPRFIPGIGTSERPPLMEAGDPAPAEVVHVPEQDGLLACRRFSRQAGLLVGGSTGSVIAGFERYAAEHALEDATVMLICPDLGQAYLSTVYDDAWARAHYPGADLSLEAGAHSAT
nr:2,3-diaminopropionate biosynthesis protein SbnA [Luteimonas sp. XNQY3]